MTTGMRPPSVPPTRGEVGSPLGRQTKRARSPPYKGGSRSSGSPYEGVSPFPGREGGQGVRYTENDAVFSDSDGVRARIVTACCENVVDTQVFRQG